MTKFKHFAGDYWITFKDGSKHRFSLTAGESKAIYEKFMWIKSFNIKSIEPDISHIPY